jgi:hypothetical protein
MPKTRRRRGGSMYSKGDILQKDCNSTLSECNVSGCNDDKVVLDMYDNNNKVWIGHEYGKNENDTSRTIPIYDKDIACWKPVTTGGKRKRRRKTSKKGGSKRKRSRRRR